MTFCGWARTVRGHCGGLKEDLRDLSGRRLFPDRHAHTVAFKLTSEEFDLYKAVTAYINQFLPQASGQTAGERVALRANRLPTTTGQFDAAITSRSDGGSKNIQDLLEELEELDARPEGQTVGATAGPPGGR